MAFNCPETLLRGQAEVGLLEADEAEKPEEAEGERRWIAAIKRCSYYCLLELSDHRIMHCAATRMNCIM